MTPQLRLARLHPTRFFLDPSDTKAIEAWLKLQQWIQPEEHVQSAARAGDGNMNCTLRVATTAQSFILKQARPWVEKYPSIDAPDERSLIEAAFYTEIAASPAVSTLMPRLIAHSPEHRILMLEDLSPATDYSDIYATSQLAPADLQQLTHWLHSLHTNFTHPSLAARFANPAMRALNHAHIFDLPLRRDNGWNFDGAATLQNDSDYVNRVHDLGHLYLGPGQCLIHGDFFPGSWLRSHGHIRVIDPEFCFWGIPEFDFGVLLAHCLLARIPAPSATPLAKAFAGVEIMRRLIGVAQLPLPYGLDEKTRLLDLSRTLVLA